jgi:hypothetical protein
MGTGLVREDGKMAGPTDSDAVLGEVDEAVVRLCLAGVSFYS